MNPTRVLAAQCAALLVGCASAGGVSNDDEPVPVGDCVSCAHRVQARITLPDRPSPGADYVYISVESDPPPDRIGDVRELPPTDTQWPYSIPLRVEWLDDKVPPSSLVVSLSTGEDEEPFWSAEYLPEYDTVQDECDAGNTCQWSSGPDLTASW